MSNQHLLAIIREIKHIQQIADEANATVESLKDQVKKHMAENGLERLNVDIFKVSYAPVITTRIDTKALTAELPDIALRFSKTSENRRLSIVA